MPERANSSIDHCWREGRRIVMATVPGVVAGGSTICTRSPPGNAAESNGEAASMRWPGKLATSLANRTHQSKLISGMTSRRQPVVVSMNASPGRFTHSSVTFGSSRKRCIVRSVKPSAECSGFAAASAASGALSTALAPALLLAAGTAELINASEIDIARDQDLDAITVILAHRGYNAQRALEHLGRDILRCRGVVDDRSTAPIRRLYGRLHSAVDGGDE